MVVEKEPWREHFRLTEQGSEDWLAAVEALLEDRLAEEGVQELQKVTGSSGHRAHRRHHRTNQSRTCSVKVGPRVDRRWRYRRSR